MSWGVDVHCISSILLHGVLKIFISNKQYPYAALPYYLVIMHWYSMELESRNHPSKWSCQRSFHLQVLFLWATFSCVFRRMRCKIQIARFFLLPLNVLFECSLRVSILARCRRQQMIKLIMWPLYWYIKKPYNVCWFLDVLCWSLFWENTFSINARQAIWLVDLT